MLTGKTQVFRCKVPPLKESGSGNSAQHAIVSRMGCYSHVFSCFSLLGILRNDYSQEPLKSLSLSLWPHKKERRKSPWKIKPFRCQLVANPVKLLPPSYHLHSLLSLGTYTAVECQNWCLSGVFGVSCCFEYFEKKCLSPTVYETSLVKHVGHQAL